ncbi:hypothetical protein ABBQ32_004933 [Trebouxia sp. C0010 RCD-2024]
MLTPGIAFQPVVTYTTFFRRNATRCRLTSSPDSVAGPEPTEAQRTSQVRATVTRRIQTLGRQKRPKEAVSQLAEMARLGVQPDTQAATALIDACVRNRKMDMAQRVFEELFGEFLEPDDVTFSVLMRGYGEMNPPSWVLISGLLKMMDQKFSMKPSLAVHNTMLDICSRTRDEQRGVEIIDMMHSAGLQPDDFTLDIVKQRKVLRSHLKRVYS